ncbi:MAG: hypothetical protein PHH85_02175 [Candidatus Methanoperedens sp.]|nr:hypothetical protein [Candidatus Methanoperedens sp.]
MATEAAAATANNKIGLDPRELSLSEVPDELLPAFGTIEQSVILLCKIAAGKITMEELEKKYRRGKVSKVGRV